MRGGEVMSEDALTRLVGLLLVLLGLWMMGAGER